VELPAVVAGYWILLLGFGAAGAWLAVSGRRYRIGVLLFVCSCIVAVGTIFEPEIDEKLVARATAHAPPPRALVIRTTSPDAERLAAAFAATDFELFIAPAGSSLTAPLPPCRAEIRLDGLADADDALAQTAQVLVVREAGVPCPFYGPHRELPLSIQQTRRLLPYVSYFGRAMSAVPSVRLIGIIASPTRDSLLRSLGMKSPPEP
jgi:hypothetical protein